MKKIVFVTGTRADFSKIKSIMQMVQNDPSFELYIFATGMHLSKDFGLTVREIEKSGFKNIFKFINHDRYYQSTPALASTIDGFFKFVLEYEPDLIVIHGDRIEPLAAASVGALNNTLVAHIEGGEVSGTIDESLRHAISKLSHIHLVNDDMAKTRLIQLGENKNNIFIIGSADLDLLNSDDIDIKEAKGYYDIDFDSFGICIFHPVTTELESLKEQAKELVCAMQKSGKNFIVIYPNNDFGFDLILEAYASLKNSNNFKLFPSLRFEYFVALLKEAEFIIGNSSCGLKEAPFLGIPTINVGTRQNGRSGIEQCINVKAEQRELLKAIQNLPPKKPRQPALRTRSDERFLELLKSGVFWQIDKQKIFQDIL